jgi:hypothetical protein
VPADHGLGLDDDKDIDPARPKVAEGSPEESVPAVQSWPWPFPFEHGDLLSECEDFEGGIAPTAEEDADHGEDGEEEFEHEITLVT